MKRSYEQLKLYFGYIKQLMNKGVISVQLGDKVWTGDLKKVMTRDDKGKLKNDPRYLLKALDLELPVTNDKFPLESANKNEFHKTDMTDLTHHMSFLRELLWDNKIIPFNEAELYKD